MGDEDGCREEEVEVEEKGRAGKDLLCLCVFTLQKRITVFPTADETFRHTVMNFSLCVSVSGWFLQHMIAQKN